MVTLQTFKQITATTSLAQISVCSKAEQNIMEMRIEPEVDKIGTCLQQTSLKYFPIIFAIRLLIMVLIRRNILNNVYPLWGGIAICWNWRLDINGVRV